MATGHPFSREQIHDAFARGKESPAYAPALRIIEAEEAARNSPHFAELERKVGPERAALLVKEYAFAAGTADFQKEQEASPAQTAIAHTAFVNAVIARNPDAAIDLAAVVKHAEKMWGELGTQGRAAVTTNLSAIPAALDGVKPDRRLASADERTISYSEAAAGGRWVNGTWVLGADAAFAYRIAQEQADDRTLRSGQSSQGYRQMTNLDLAMRGIGNARDFAASDFARQGGLDYETFKYLRGTGQYSGANILHAGIDAKALGLNKDRDAVEDLAILDKHDPEGRTLRKKSDEDFDRWLKAHRKEIDDWNRKLAQAPDGAQRDAVLQGYNDFIEQGARDTGVTDYDNRLKQRGVPQKVINARTRTKQRLLKKAKVDQRMVHKIGVESTAANLDAVAKADKKPSVDVANAAGADATAFLDVGGEDAAESDDSVTEPVQVADATPASDAAPASQKPFKPTAGPGGRIARL